MISSPVKNDRNKAAAARAGECREQALATVHSSAKYFSCPKAQSRIRIERCRGDIGLDRCRAHAAGFGFAARVTDCHEFLCACSRSKAMHRRTIGRVNPVQVVGKADSSIGS